MTKKNILFLTNSISYGGAAKMLCFVANELQKRGFNVSILNYNTTQKNIEYSQGIHKDIKVFDYRVGGIKGLKRLYQIWYTRKIAKETGANVIICFTFMPNAIGCIVGKMLNIPSIMSERADPYRTVTSSFADRLLLKIINKSAGGVFQIQGAREFYGKGLQERATVIPNPIFLKEDVVFSEFSKREKSVVSVGRFDNGQKRYDIMLRAFAIFSKKHPEYILKLFGEGPDKSFIEEEIEKLDMQDKIIIKGFTSNPMKDILKDGIFLITSDFEGISNSMLEAMAIGLPVVSTDSSPGGARMVITDHEDGLIAPAGDYEKIAAALCEFAENEELAKKCGDNARAVVERFAPEKIIKQWEEYILEVTERFYDKKNH